MKHGARTGWVVAICVLIVASIAIGYAVMGPRRAEVSDEAVRAADALRREASGASDGRTQPTNEQGVPRDAQGTAAGAGRIEVKTGR